MSFVWKILPLLEEVSGRLVQEGEGDTFSTIVTDTRLPEEKIAGSLFVALKGSHYDGHDFVDLAIAKGAKGIVVEREVSSKPSHVAVFQVPSTLNFLGILARKKRETYKGVVIGVTGSAGKTTTKVLIHAFLGGRGYLASGNWNNAIGVPLSVFSAPLSAEYWVLELAMNHPGEIAYLVSIVSPDLAVLLPPGRAHIGFFRKKEEIVKAKAEMITTPPYPRKIVYAHPAYRRYLPPSADAVEVGKRGTVKVTKASLRFPEGTVYTIRFPFGTRNISTNLLGDHFKIPVATSATVAWVMGRTTFPENISLSNPPGRMSLYPFGEGWVLDDSYNASPESYLSFLSFLKRVKIEQNFSIGLFLGEMRELGRYSLFLHRMIVRRIKTFPLKFLYSLGEDLNRALYKEGVEFVSVRDPEEGVSLSLSQVSSGTLLGLKGAYGTGIHQAWEKVRKEKKICSIC